MSANWLIAANHSGVDSKIQRTFASLNYPTGYGVSVDHRRFQIAVAEQFLNGGNFDVGLQQMAGKACGNLRGRTVFIAIIQIKPKPFMTIAALLVRNIVLIELRLKRLTEGCGNG